MRKTVIASIICVFCVALTMLSACSTVDGVGKDTQKVGGAVGGAIRDVSGQH